MKNYILTNPESIKRVMDVYSKLMYSKLGCCEIEHGLATDIANVAKDAVNKNRKVADVTGIFSQTPKRYGGRHNEDDILVSNQLLIKILTERVFDVVAENEEDVLIAFKA